MSVDFNYDLFFKEFSDLQEKMLFFEKSDVKAGFKTLYQNSTAYFQLLFNQHKNTLKGDRYFFVKKQSQMILRYFSELEQANLSIDSMTEIELIRLFEKQYKLKKIVLKLKNQA